MRKSFISILIMLISIFQAYGQNNTQSEIVEYFINKAVSLLGETVPDGFRRVDRTTFANNEDIIIITEDEKIVISYIGSIFNTTHEAHELNGLLYDYFENRGNNWSFVSSTDNGTDLYFRDDIYAGISSPSRRDDGLIVTGVGFSRKIHDF